ncbi:MAG: hypothetical protein AUG49_09130 [Catenulispora sp. 13_1_20CM_3_70_7]|nr:MAG: hypothetical protein AUG49_09130 [Catenulispora sp. 13_1_20CM_3_70_7]
MSARHLALSPQRTSTAELLDVAAARRGMVSVEVSHPVPEQLAGACHYYGGPLFADKVAPALGLALLEPHDAWLPGLPPELTGRTIEAMSLGDARRLRHPMFVKPPSDKGFEAGVYADGTRLPGPDKLPARTPVQVSEIVTFAREYRLFVLDGEVRAASRYAVFGRLDAAPVDEDPERDAVLGFAEDVLGAAADSLPSAVVVDVGLITPADRHDSQWAVVEANMAWFANSYAADPDRVLDVVLAAAHPARETAERDRDFVRRV